MIKLQEMLPNLIVKPNQSSVLRRMVPQYLINGIDISNLKMLEKDVLTINPVSSRGIYTKMNEYKGQEELYNSPETYLFRQDIDWKNLGEYFHNKYKDTSKVNFKIFGCSTGQEAYSSSIILDIFSSKNKKKYYPIDCYDINKSIIEEAKEKQATNFSCMSNNINLNSVAQKLDIPREKLNDYFILENAFDVKLNPKITQNINFHHGNIFDEWQNIDKKSPSIIMCRNMWPYVDEKHHQFIAEKLYENLAPNSCVIIGAFDNERPSFMKFSTSLKNAGFIPTEHGVNKDYNPDKIVFERN